MANRTLVCTDLDRTLIPNGPLPESPAAEERFANLASREDIILAYVSGRHRELVEQAMEQYQLPVPDFVIGDVGTTIYQLGPQHAWTMDKQWQLELAADWHGHTTGQLLDKLASVGALRAQEPEKQGRFKLSFYLDIEEDRAALDIAIREILVRAGVSARLVWSIDDLTGEVLLDVLPRRASKRHAIEALMAQLGLVSSQTVFCGDSGNDLEVLISPIPAVLVANARAEVKREASEKARQQGNENTLYIARGGFLGMNGNYRGGMLEGICHYHSEMESWLAVENASGECA